VQRLALAADTVLFAANKAGRAASTQDVKQPCHENLGHVWRVGTVLLSGS